MSERLQEDGWVRRATPLQVSAPFHTPPMRPAARVLATALGWHTPVVTQEEFDSEGNGQAADADRDEQSSSGSSRPRPRARADAASLAAQALLATYGGSDHTAAQYQAMERDLVQRIIEGAYKEGWTNHLPLQPQTRTGNTLDQQEAGGVHAQGQGQGQGHGGGVPISNDLLIPLVSNVHSGVIHLADDAAALCIAQACMPVRFSAGVLRALRME